MDPYITITVIPEGGIRVWSDGDGVGDWPIHVEVRGKDASTRVLLMLSLTDAEILSRGLAAAGVVPATEPVGGVRG